MGGSVRRCLRSCILCLISHVHVGLYDLELAVGMCLCAACVIVLMKCLVARLMSWKVLMLDIGRACSLPVVKESPSAIL